MAALFENNQTSSLDARNTFAAAVPHLVMNDFGAFFGGPVTVPKLYHGTDRTFFFMSYEGLRRPNQAVIIDSVPTAAMRAGDLSVYLPKTVVKDPSYRVALSRTTRFPPTGFLHFRRRLRTTSSRCRIMAPQDALANNYETAFPTPISSNQGDLRVDHNISPNRPRSRG